MKWKNKGHEFDEVGKQFEDVEEVVVYGAGEYGTELARYLKGIDASFVFVDEYKYKNKKYMDVDVLSKDMLEWKILNHKKILVVLAMGSSNAAIVLKQLEQKGLRYGINIFDIHSFMNYYLYLFAAYRYDKCIMQMCGTMAVYRCSLQCKYCMGAFPYLKKDNIPFEEAKRDVDVLFSKVDYIDNYGIGCGDVLLYKDFDRYLEYVLVNYGRKIGKAEVLLNGMLLPRENVINVIRKYDLEVEISNYSAVEGWTKRYERLMDVLRENDIRTKNIVFNSWIDMGWLDKKDKGNASEKFEACCIPCRIVKDGKLYYCIHGMTASEALYNNENKEEGLNLNEVSNKKIILEYHMGYNEQGALPMCGYCNGYLNINHKTISIAEQLRG